MGNSIRQPDHSQPICNIFLKWKMSSNIFNMSVSPGKYYIHILNPQMFITYAVYIYTKMHTKNGAPYTYIYTTQRWMAYYKHLYIQKNYLQVCPRCIYTECGTYYIPYILLYIYISYRCDSDKDVLINMQKAGNFQNLNQKCIFLTCNTTNESFTLVNGNKYGVSTSLWRVPGRYRQQVLGQYWSVTHA